MTKQGNFTQRTPQAKKQSDQASRQVSKQASGSTNTPYDLVFPATGPSLGTTQPTATITSTEDLQRAAFTTPPQTAPEANTTEPPPPPIRNKGPELGADNLTLEGVATELAPSDFVSQNYETLVALMQEETKKRSSQSLQARLNFGPEDEVSPPRHQKERHRKDNRRPPVFGRIGKQVSGTQTANLQNFLLELRCYLRLKSCGGLPLKFYAMEKWAKNPVELARRAPFRLRSQGEASAAAEKKGTRTLGHWNQSGDNQRQSSSRKTTAYLRSEGGRCGKTSTLPMTMTPKDILCHRKKAILPNAVRQLRPSLQLGSSKAEWITSEEHQKKERNKGAAAERRTKMH
ncbi:hypothetical protein Tco_0486449 [Tanacetum coccineum]